MDDSANEGAARAPFDRVWSSLPGRAQVEAVSTLDTVAYEVPADAAISQPLPKVGHLAKLGAELGRGGNGEVLSADQMGLDRQIAVKRALADAPEEIAGVLLQEARVIGYLEHPNIPPVHYVGVSADDALLVGLKKIEGETLADRFEREPGLENIEENLDILIQITNAVGFAHNRGILHLDLKPANVMTGLYGEVYVLDWGLAVAFRDDVPESLPRPIVNGQVYGTPAFVAPETVTGDSSSPATDVYQLGGILHCLLTGSPPNRGTSTFEVLRAAYEPEPRSFPAQVPERLASICERALAVDPKERYVDANALREALVGYRRDRREFEAIAVAQDQVDALQVVLQAKPDDAAVVYQRYGRTRQAIDEAAGLHGDEKVTQVLLQGVLEALIRWELERKNVGSAAFLLSELPEENEPLAAAIEDQERRQASQMAELRALRDEIDPSIGNAVKLTLVVTLGLMIALVELVPFLMGIETTPKRVLIGNLVYMVFLIGTSIRFRKALFATRVNRGLTAFIWLLSLFGTLLRVGCVQGLFPLYTMVGYDLALVTMINLYAAVLLDRRLLFAVPSYTFFAISCFLWPEKAMPIYGMAHFVGLTTLGVSLAHIKPPSSDEDEA